MSEASPQLIARAAWYSYPRNTITRIVTLLGMLGGALATLCYTAPLLYTIDLLRTLALPYEFAAQVHQITFQYFLFLLWADYVLLLRVSFLGIENKSCCWKQPLMCWRDHIVDTIFLHTTGLGLSRLYLDEIILSAS
jgi:hypothetical protein